MTSNLHEVLQVWSQIFAREHGSKKGAEWIAETKGELEKRLGEDHELAKFAFIKFKAPQTHDVELLEPIEPASAPKEVEWKFRCENGQDSDIEREINLKATFRSEQRFTSDYSKQVEFGAGLSAQLPFVSIEASMKSALNWSHGEANSTGQEKESGDLIKLKFKRRTTTHVTVTNTIQKIRRKARCKVSLDGFVVVSCEDKIDYSGPYNKSKSEHKCVVPIAQVLEDIKRYATWNDKLIAERAEEIDISIKKIITRGELNGLKSFLKEAALSCDHGEVYFWLEREAAETMYVSGNYSSKQEPLTSVSSSPADLNEPLSGAQSGLKIFIEGELKADSGGVALSEGETPEERRQAIQDFAKHILPQMQSGGTASFFGVTASGKGSVVYKGNAANQFGLAALRLQQAQAPSTISLFVMTPSQLSQFDGKLPSDVAYALVENEIYFLTKDHVDQIDIAEEQLQRLKIKLGFGSYDAAAEPVCLTKNLTVMQRSFIKNITKHDAFAEPKAEEKSGSSYRP